MTQLSIWKSQCVARVWQMEKWMNDLYVAREYNALKHSSLTVFSRCIAAKANIKGRRSNVIVATWCTYAVKSAVVSYSNLNHSSSVIPVIISTHTHTLSVRFFYKGSLRSLLLWVPELYRLYFREDQKHIVYINNRNIRWAQSIIFFFYYYVQYNQSTNLSSICKHPWPSHWLLHDHQASPSCIHFCSAAWSHKWTLSNVALLACCCLVQCSWLTVSQRVPATHFPNSPERSGEAAAVGRPLVCRFFPFCIAEVTDLPSSSMWMRCDIRRAGYGRWLHHRVYRKKRKYFSECVGASGEHPAGPDSLLFLKGRI